jgi:thiol-disulfide isomerase/thioredoxin
MMLRKTLTVVYTAFILGANAGWADVSALRDGDMKKLAFHETPAPIPEVGLVDADDAPRSLAEYRGKWVVLNFWATWCAPCRHEMPSLDRLQAAMPEIAVVPVATGRNAVAGIQRFFEEEAIVNLPILRDPTSEQRSKVAQHRHVIGRLFPAPHGPQDAAGMGERPRYRAWPRCDPAGGPCRPRPSRPRDRTTSCKAAPAGMSCRVTSCQARLHQAPKMIDLDRRVADDLQQRLVVPDVILARGDVQIAHQDRAVGLSQRK